MEVLASRVLLHPSDFDRSFDFYARVLGLHLFREWGNGTARGAVFFTGGGYLELSGRNDEGPAGGRLGLWWQVRELDTEYERLVEAGVDVREPPVDKPWGLREARIVDPDGLVIVIVEVPDDHPLRRDTR